jgi:hypothetical protein
VLFCIHQFIFLFYHSVYVSILIWTYKPVLCNKSDDMIFRRFVIKVVNLPMCWQNGKMLIKGYVWSNDLLLLFIDKNCKIFQKVKTVVHITLELCFQSYLSTFMGKSVEKQQFELLAGVGHFQLCLFYKVYGSPASSDGK